MLMPTDYVCAECECSGVRLYRAYGQPSIKKLLCRTHALQDQKRDEPDNDTEHSIGWLVAAVPTGDGSYWGYTAVPDDGVEWWNNLPKEPTQ